MVIKYQILKLNTEADLWNSKVFAKNYVKIINNFIYAKILIGIEISAYGKTIIKMT